MLFPDSAPCYALGNSLVTPTPLFHSYSSPPSPYSYSSLHIPSQSGANRIPYTPTSSSPTCSQLSQDVVIIGATMCL
jgi:hypothetical protein